MNKFLLASVTALGAVLLSDRPADAWINAKFSVGLNYHWQSGNNNLLWGAFRDGQVPGPLDGYHAPHGPIIMPPGHHNHGDFQFFGAQPKNTPPITNTPGPPQQRAYDAHLWQQQNPYHATSYTPGYYGYFQPPSYWYGR